MNIYYRELLKTSNLFSKIQSPSFATGAIETIVCNDLINKESLFFKISTTWFVAHKTLLYLCFMCQIHDERLKFITLIYFQRFSGYLPASTNFLILSAASCLSAA